MTERIALLDEANKKRANCNYENSQCDGRHDSDTRIERRRKKKTKQINEKAKQREKKIVFG